MAMATSLNDEVDQELLKTEINHYSNTPEEYSDEDDNKTPEETVDVDAHWLHTAGFSDIVSQLTDGQDVKDDDMENITSTLTRKQADVLRKRVNSLSATLKSKSKSSTHTDVRDIFPERAEETEIKDFSSFDERSVQISGTPKNSKNDLPTITDNEESNYHIKFERSNSRKGVSDLPYCEIKDEDVTLISDLSKADVLKLHSFVFMELTAIFDDHGLNITKKKTKKKFKEFGIFGTSLQTLYDRDVKKHPDLLVPLILKQMIGFLQQKGLREEGILRVPGAMARIKQHRQVIEAKFPSGNFDWDHLDAKSSDVAGLLKQFLRELPQPLLTNEYIDAFSQVEEIKGVEAQVQALMMLFILLPDVHRNSLKLILAFLKLITENEEKNRMNLHNVSTIMAPNLFSTGKSKRDSSKPQTFQLHAATKCFKVVRLLIQYEKVWGIVPGFLLNQIRPPPTNKGFNIKKFFGRKDKSPNKTTALEEERKKKNRIKVTMGTSVSKDIHLHTGLTAGQVVEQILKEESVLSGSNLEGLKDKFLYEKGGNINCRKLNPNCRLMQAFRDNPFADWIISSKPPVS
ncbi:DgyrCDS1881 [Dimorphilus gyrociliatus]|uniref:DgyrCDS1881 n=1 Tax=Dimorphilus gyrociliatus TaxID=2664684 RepID=A0A7I8V8N2_9ANNE|nr:DgyrCDS1881 [Dimorphilus gyrociliatus]